jgi:hypothetical protein
MSTEWITDRLPTKKDGQDDYGWLWVTIDGQVVHRQWSKIKEGQPWKFAIIKPTPYTTNAINTNNEEMP